MRCSRDKRDKKQDKRFRVTNNLFEFPTNITVVERCCLYRDGTAEELNSRHLISQTDAIPISTTDRKFYIELVYIYR